MRGRFANGTPGETNATCNRCNAHRRIIDVARCRADLLKTSVLAFIRLPASSFLALPAVERRRLRSHSQGTNVKRNHQRKGVAKPGLRIRKQND